MFKQCDITSVSLTNSFNPLHFSGCFSARLYLYSQGSKLELMQSIIKVCGIYVYLFDIFYDHGIL